ncbi:hypothetical protein [Sediminicola luteus]|uniref:Membrane protein 6-pyruvoyl-tetrahydropterin synthase-related domain-containing protein n=1 Tax=Sediminicola luteus TaxID=319238 RepID=A0A2A4G3I0_9FLAO|nr:hypothetical protein [Sediminicola luteus]PCE62516.1 hypothetical protein B7P33_17930 [Sediminicola luteus]
MYRKTYSLLALALVFGLIFHGVGIFFTLETTYDALIHLFFADHYAKDWFEPWDYRWYTGFTVQAYPPLVHQCMALLSYLGGLKFGLFTMAILVVVLFITGVYRFALVLTTNQKMAGYAALMGVFSSMFLETLHLFGQLPSLMGISVLLHALPEIYAWIKLGRIQHLLTSLSLIALTVTSHHVTPIFGMVFFVFPLIGLVIMDVSRDQVDSNKEIVFWVFYRVFRRLFWRIVSFGMGSLVLIIFCMLPYWINTKKNPITQVPIPHGSRDNFLEVLSSGLVFFIIPWGALLLLIPFLFYRFYSKRLLFFGLSFSLLSLLGTGGTTPLPKMMLGQNAFEILTLDRFTLWATIMALPLLGEFTYRLAEGDFKQKIIARYRKTTHYLISAIFGSVYIGMAIFTMSLGYFRPAQPQKIKMLPIVNFLNQDQHDQWRYLTLGFGDQMAWLSAQTKAMTVDGNYHSARRLPELTTRAIERLENSKFRGVEGIGSLQQFLTVPEKYSLKYIFSNDKFYDPILYYCGWQRLQQLENGIMVWERLNVKPIPKIIPKEDVADFLKIMWGLIPMGTLIIAFIINIQMLWWRKLRGITWVKVNTIKYLPSFKGPHKALGYVNGLWVLGLMVLFMISMYRFYLYSSAHHSPENVIKAYYDALDFKEFERAHSYLDPDSGISISQYMLEVSVSDGLLSSYAKLDSIGIEVQERDSASCLTKTYTQWITPLEKVADSIQLELIKKQGKWYIKALAKDNDIPPNQLMSSNQTTYFNHGRRRVTTEQTHHEDVLRQPLLEILSAKLVKYNGKYSIIGSIQNIDNVPADVSLKGTLYNDRDKVLASYDAKYHIKHKLMPKETTPFRIDFEGIAWSSTLDTIPPTFDPDTFTPIDLDEVPKTFDLQCSGNMAITDLYKSLALQQVFLDGNSVQGTLFNFGIQEVTVPQLITSYYKKDEGLVWVDHHFVLDGVRIQRKQRFTYDLADTNRLEVVYSGLENCYVNGIPNNDIVNKYTHDTTNEYSTLGAIHLNDGTTDYIRIDLNPFIGNPK